MNKVKIKDLFIAGLTFGGINGLIHNLYIFILNLFNINTRIPWGDAAALFFDPPECNLLPAQIFGFLMSLNAPMFIGITLCLLVKFTGRDFIYLKSIVLAELTTFLTFAVVYPPLLGLKFVKHSIPTVYGALFGMFLFGLVLGYLVKKYTNFGDSR